MKLLWYNVPAVYDLEDLTGGVTITLPLRCECFVKSQGWGMGPCNPGRETNTQVGLELTIAKSDYFAKTSPESKVFNQFLKINPFLGSRIKIEKFTQKIFFD